MKITIRQFKNRFLTNHVKNSVSFFAEQLGLTKKEIHNLKIKIVMVDDLQADGFCMKLSKKNYYFEINRDLSYEQLMLTIAHEMVHVKQYILGELKSCYIRGKPVDVWRGMSYTYTKYLDQPWEQEATELEGDLYMNYVSECFALGKLDFEKLKHV